MYENLSGFDINLSIYVLNINWHRILIFLKKNLFFSEFWNAIIKLWFFKLNIEIKIRLLT